MCNSPISQHIITTAILSYDLHLMQLTSGRTARVIKVLVSAVTSKMGVANGRKSSQTFTAGWIWNLKTCCLMTAPSSFCYPIYTLKLINSYFTL
jgi:hypothetical protein